MHSNPQNRPWPRNSWTRLGRNRFPQISQGRSAGSGDSGCRPGGRRGIPSTSRSSRAVTAEIPNSLPMRALDQPFLYRSATLPRRAAIAPSLACRRAVPFWGPRRCLGIPSASRSLSTVCGETPSSRATASALISGPYNSTTRRRRSPIDRRPSVWLCPRWEVLEGLNLLRRSRSEGS